MNASVDSSSARTTPRVTPRLGPAFGGVLRMTWGQQIVTRNVFFSTLVITGVAVIGYLIALREAQGFINWINQIVLMLGVPVVAFDAGARAIREDLKPGAVDYVITRPVPRWAYALFKYISQWCVIMVLATGALIFMLSIGLALAVPLLPLPLYFGVMTVGVSAFLALGFLMGSITSRYLLLGLLYAGLIEAGVGNIPTQLNNLSILRHLWVALEGPVKEGGTVGHALAVVLLIAVVLLGAAILIFSRKEFIGKKSDEA